MRTTFSHIPANFVPDLLINLEGNMNYKRKLSLFIISIMLLTGRILKAESADTLWTFTTGKKILASPVSVDNKILVGSDDRYFYCLNSQTGEEIWSFFTDTPIRSTAVVHNNFIYFEGNNILFCLNIDGEEQWRDTLYTGRCNVYIDNWDYYHSSPVIIDNVLYICTQGGLALGFNVEDGSEVFRVQTTLQATIRTTPAISDGKIYFGDWEGRFYCYDLSTAELVWMYNAYAERAWSSGSQITTSPVVAEGKVYFAGRGSVLFCLNASTGEKIWSFRSPTSQWLVGGPTYEDGVIYLGTSDQKKFRAFNAETGEIFWQVSIPINLFSTPFIIGDVIYIGTGNAYSNTTGNILAVNKRTGSIIKRLDYSTAVYSSPLRVDDILYFCTYSGVICAINSQSTTGISEQKINESYNLKQNYPNPFNPSSTIEYTVPESGHVMIDVYDSIGRFITKLIDEEKVPGAYSTVFHANNLSSGTYFYTLKTATCTITRKMLLLK